VDDARIAGIEQHVVRLPDFLEGAGLAEQTFAELLADSYDYERPTKGQLRDGVILRVEERGITIDVGAKREGFVPYRDIERLGKEAPDLEPGQEVTARVVKPEDRAGNLILSLYQARQEKDWKKAEDLLESGKVWEGQVTACNRGGLVLKFGSLRGFLPGSHLWEFNGRRVAPDQREEKFREYIGRELCTRVIEVERHRRRLILSERKARRQMHQRRMEQLLEELLEGQVCEGTVTRLVDFGAFVDLGGADGLIHISELAWHRVQHPREVLQVGDAIKVYVLRLDHERKRIGLSLKRLQPDPWQLLDRDYSEGQLVSGQVTSIADFGVFVALDVGVEGLVHVSELEDPIPNDTHGIVQIGDEVLVRIIRIESARRRVGLSLKRVSEQEHEEWMLASAPQDDTDGELSEEEDAVDDDVPVAAGPESVDEPAAGDADMAQVGAL
jgi:small subunit ribosomal protein S1